MNKILIVDNDPDNLSFIKDSLVDPNYKVTLIDNINDALAELKKEKYSVVISDICMPEEQNGYYFINTVYQEYPHIIIIVVSGHTEINFVIKILSEKKVYNYLLKPYKAEILKLSVEKALELFDLRNKKEEFARQEECAFKDIIQIFDWKKEINTKYLDSIASDLIRQINIGMLQGSGVGSLASALSILFNKSEYLQDLKGFFIPEKVFNLIKKNYNVVSSLLASLSDAQAIMLETNIYSEMDQAFNIIPSFREIANELRPMLKIKNQKIILSELPRATHCNYFIYNKDKMNIVIQELFINAMKYSGNNDNIYALFFSNPDSFDIKILNKAYRNSDGTIGISGKNEARVFEPFFRIQNTVDDNYSLEKFKFGLGLTIVKKIMQLHKADISIYSIKNSINNSQFDVCVWLRFPYIVT